MGIDTRETPPTRIYTVLEPLGSTSRVVCFFFLMIYDSTYPGGFSPTLRSIEVSFSLPVRILHVLLYTVLQNALGILCTLQQAAAVPRRLYILCTIRPLPQTFPASAATCSSTCPRRPWTQPPPRRVYSCW